MNIFTRRGSAALVSARLVSFALYVADVFVWSAALCCWRQTTAAIATCRRSFCTRGTLKITAITIAAAAAIRAHCQCISGSNTHLAQCHRIEPQLPRQPPALRARRQMLARVLTHPQLDFAFLTGHECFLTYFANFTRATQIWLRTVTSSTPKIFATSCVDSPSISRSTIAVRSRSPNVCKPSFNSLLRSSRVIVVSASADGSAACSSGSADNGSFAIPIVADVYRYPIQPRLRIALNLFCF